MTQSSQTKINIPIVDLKSQYGLIKDEIEKAVLDVLSSGSYILGKNVEALEEEISKYIGVNNVISCANGTDAIYLSLRALDIGYGDEVITVSHSFFATAGAILNTGAKPVFVEIKEDDFNIDPDKIQSAITKNTKAIIPVHIYGQPCNLDEILQIAKRNNLYVIEDTAQAFGAKYKARFAGTLGDLGAFSFFPTKNFGAYGDAGAICTNDDNLASILRQLRVHGSPGRYIHNYIGINSRLDEIQAVILRIKLRHLEKWNNMRFQAAKRYNELLKDIPGVIIPSIKPQTSHIFHQYTIRIQNRDEVQKKMLENGIQSIIYYPIPIHRQKAIKNLHIDFDLPITEKISREIVSLPMYPEITLETQKIVVEELKKAINS